ncbi:MAG: ABC transporter substrate-binding protein [Telmatospirillum sp.]|nr:ABC transporter substrate-binding protein [Telmatospirillum sp.]
MMVRRLFLSLAAAFVLAAGTFAVPAHAQDGEAAQKFIAELARQAITTVADRQLPQAERESRFRKLFVTAFDLSEIGRFVLSRSWRTATPDQQQEFLSLFEDITVLTWAKRFQDYNGESLETGGVTRDGDRGWVVDSHILRAQGQQIPVQWKVKQSEDGSFRVIDIVVEGVSMAITHRSDYAAALQANGGKVDGLLSTMRTKLDQLKAAG